MAKEEYQIYYELSEQILSDLISQGFEGPALSEKFKEQSRAFRPALQKMIER